MHSIIDSQRNCVGQYVFIKDDKYTTRLFARFYNMCINKEEVPITENDIINFIKMRKYHLENTIHIYDLSTDTITLKELKPGDVMIYMNTVNKLYLATEKELNNFLNNNSYTSILSMTYVLGIPDTDKFINARPISSNNIDNAKRIYKNRYNIKEDPVLIGIKEYESLYINVNNHILVADIDEKTIIKNEEDVEQ